MSKKKYTLPIPVDQLDYSKPISFYANLFKIPVNTLRRMLKREGVYKNFYFTSGAYTSTLKAAQAEEEYKKCPKKCQECNKDLEYKQRHNRFCSSSCSQTFKYRTNPSLGVEQGKKIKERMANGTWKKPPLAKQNLRPRPKGQRVEKRCETCGCPMFLLPHQERRGRKFCSFKCAKASPKLGGYREGSGRAKSGWYKGIFCGSSWELAWVIYSIDHGISFQRNKEGFSYVYNGELHEYFPDFILFDGTYLEVKGYKTLQWEEKLSQFAKKIQVLTKKEMEPILKYVKDKYGNDFIRMYSGNPHDDKLEKCIVCGSPCKNKCCSRVCAGKNAKRLWKEHREKTEFIPAIS